MSSPHLHARVRPGAITATALPSPALRTASILAFLPALPLCITHGTLSNDIVPAIGLVPLFFSASVSLFLLLRTRRQDRGTAARGETGLDPEGSLIHSYLAAREFVAGLAIPGLIEYTAWRMVPADCPHCGNRLRPDTLPPVPWYETVSRPKVSMLRMRASSISRPSLPAFKLPKFSSLKGPREWKVPAWMRGRKEEDASLFVDDAQNERDGYRDDPDDTIGGPSSHTSVVATGSAGPAPVVEEVVVGKKDKRGKNGSSPALFGEEDSTWT
ncbi:hypothetical protein N0V88_002150 [Collariella sp. IMI 366227]|nr:hypothetical protein N0V88_002150 [Collariella sp. IMI 366227]